jgi:hypothetical protein
MPKYGILDIQVMQMENPFDLLMLLLNKNHSAMGVVLFL